jgi:hypothetical protein
MLKILRVWGAGFFGKYINEELMKVWEGCIGITKQLTNQLTDCSRILLDESRLTAI